MTDPSTTPPVSEGHAHDVSVETTFTFLNTYEYEDGFPVDHLPTLDLALSWFADRGLIHLEGADRARRKAAQRPRAAARDLERVRTVRAALREVAAAPDGVHVDHRHVGDPVDDALARLSEAMVTELTGGHPERIRICANDTCRWVFYDTSRTARRRWCDMSTCGNRAKQARHRARAKTGSSEATPAI
jgi:hypothetical protein